MRLDRLELAKVAILRALQMRARAGCSIWDPVCVFDLAERFSVEVRFADIPSMEGVYIGGTKPSIIISSLRPAGRQSYTCGHELGHHEFGHRSQFDELVNDRSQGRRFDPKEYQADCFAGALLMPQAAVKYGFSSRRLDPNACSPESLYVVATWLGVGYATLIHHMWKALRMFTEARVTELLRHKPNSIRSRLLGDNCRSNLVVVDDQWSGRAIDVRIGDFVILPPDVYIEGACVELVARDGKRAVTRAVRSGLGRTAVRKSDWSAFLRVSKFQYVGRARYRFEEEAEDV